MCAWVFDLSTATTWFQEADTAMEASSAAGTPAGLNASPWVWLSHGADPVCGGYRAPPPPGCPEPPSGPLKQLIIPWKPCWNW